MEALIARILQIFLALTGAYSLALWFALVVWTYRDITTRSANAVTHIFSTLVVVLFWIPGVVIYLLLRPRETLEAAFQRTVEEEYLLQDLDDIQTCPFCNRAVQDDFLYCPHCRSRLRSECPDCHRLVDLRWQACPYCATDLTGVQPSVTQIRVHTDSRQSVAGGAQPVDNYRSGQRQPASDTTVDASDSNVTPRIVTPRVAHDPGSAPRQAGSDS